MKKEMTALLSGTVFGLGLTISGMINPAKVIGFLDVSGEWDPSLIVVMISALTVTALGYFIALQRTKPLFDAEFQVPKNRKADARLYAGAVIFGIGWGIAGLCPGPALSNVGLNNTASMVFIAFMAIGMFAYHKINRIIG